MNSRAIFISRLFAALVVASVLSVIIIELPRAFAFLPSVASLSLLFRYKFFYAEPLQIPVKALFVTGGIAVMVSISLLWSIDSDTSSDRVAKMILILLGGCVVMVGASSSRANDISAYMTVLLVASVIGCLLAICELNNGDFLYRILHTPEQGEKVASAVYNRGTNIIILSSFSLLAYYLYVTRKPLMIAPLYASIFALMFFTDSQSAQMALAVGIIFFFVFPYKTKWCWFALSGVVCCLTLCAPYIVQWLYAHASFINSLPFLGRESGYAGPRLEIWDYVGRYALENPLLGYGIEATKIIADFDSKEVFIEGNTILHPHNFALQLWIEFGIVGAAGACVLLNWLIWVIYKTENAATQRAALASVMATLSVSATGYGLWQSWWLGTVFVIVAHALLVNRSIKKLSCSA